MIEKKYFPRDVHIVPADNGYIGKVGCQHFVVQGYPKDISRALGKYFDMSPEIVKEMGYNGTDAFLEGDCETVGEAYPKEGQDAAPISAAYGYIREYFHSSSAAPGPKPRLITSIYEAANGTIEVNHVDKSVIVVQVIGEEAEKKPAPDDFSD